MGIIIIIIVTIAAVIIIIIIIVIVIIIIIIIIIITIIIIKLKLKTWSLRTRGAEDPVFPPTSIKFCELQSKWIFCSSTHKHLHLPSTASDFWDS